MNSNNLECLYNLLESLCRELDFLADPNIEQKMVCTLDCCIGNFLPTIFETLEKEILLTENVIGIAGLEMLRQFEKEFDEAVYYDDEKGFSGQARWKEFSVLAEDLSRHIRSSVKKHKIELGVQY